MDQSIIKQVRLYAALGYSCRRVALLVSQSEAEMKRMQVRLETPGDILRDIYLAGLAEGDMAVDKRLGGISDEAQEGGSSREVDEMKYIDERRKQQKIDDLKQELFGI